MSVDVERNYIAEALAIAKGESRIVAEKAHILALLAQNESVVTDVRTLSELIVTVLLDSQRESAVVAGWKLAALRERGLTLKVHPPDVEGAVRVEIQRRPQAHPTPMPTKVM